MWNLSKVEPVEAIKVVEAIEVLEFVEPRQPANCWLDQKDFPSCPNCKYVHPIDLNLAFKKKNIMPPKKILSFLDYDHDIVQDTK